MKHHIQLLSGAGLALVAIIGLGLQAPPAHADYTYGCSWPMLPKGPDSVMNQSWEAQGLARFLKSEILIEYKDREGRPIKVIPQYEVWTKKSSKPVATRSGRVVALDGPGRHEISSWPWDSLPRDLERYIPGDQFEVTSVRTLEEDERFSWTDRNASAAIVLLVPPEERAAERGEGNDQMMVLFIVGENGFGP